MKKIIKILIGLTVLFALLMLTVTYFLKPSDRLKNDDRLWNVSDNVDIEKLMIIISRSYLNMPWPTMGMQKCRRPATL